MLSLKIIMTLALILIILFIKSIVKLSFIKKTVQRELDNVEIEKILSPGSIQKLSIMPLVDFYASDDAFETEAGVSYYIKADDTDILLDVGFNSKKKHPSALLNNLANAGKKIKDIDFIYLSHLHLDHIGGIKDQKSKTFSLSGGFVELPEIPVYSPEPVKASDLNPGPETIVLTDPEKIKDGIISIGAIPRALYLMGYTLENSLAFNVEGKGIVVVVGCGHQTVERIIERVDLLFDEPIYGIIGGLHLPAGGGRVKVGPFDIQGIIGVDRPPWKGINQNDVDDAISSIRQVAPSFIAISPHDTSDSVLSRFKDEFGPKNHELRVGKLLEI